MIDTSKDSLAKWYFVKSYFSNVAFYRLSYPFIVSLSQWAVIMTDFVYFRHWVFNIMPTLNHGQQDERRGSTTCAALLVSMIGLAGITGLSGCDDNSQTPPNKQPKLKSNLLITRYQVSMDANYPPYSFRDDKGNAIGFDVDILTAIGEQQGFAVDIEPVAWEQVMPSVANHQYQIAIGGIAISDIAVSRAATKVIPSKAYNFGHDAIATNLYTNNINSLNDLKKKRVAIVTDSGYINDLTKLKTSSQDTDPAKHLVQEATTYLALKHLLNKKVDAVLSDRGVLLYLNQHSFTHQNPKQPFNITAEGEYFSKPYGMVFVVEKNNIALQQSLNEGIDKIIANGTYLKIHSKWFKDDSVILPDKEPDNLNKTK